MTQFFYILTYSIHVKVYCYCLDIELLLSNYYCLDIELLLLKCYCLVIELLLSNHYYLDIELLLSNCYCLNTHQIFNYI